MHILASPQGLQIDKLAISLDDKVGFSTGCYVKKGKLLRAYCFEHARLLGKRLDQKRITFSTQESHYVFYEGLDTEVARIAKSDIRMPDFTKYLRMAFPGEGFFLPRARRLSNDINQTEEQGIWAHPHYEKSGPHLHVVGVEISLTDDHMIHLTY
ncbi:MAG: hypothetical protein CMH61_00250 [Nanoarchaeota archaeon]|nr:hypothetical protein [Nanoarchaeota archaeon]|tara:strand:- start:1330 stop:1794 length:465 start_codon:yes stop_codon:yes gene_type:complete